MFLGVFTRREINCSKWSIIRVSYRQAAENWHITTGYGTNDLTCCQQIYKQTFDRTLYKSYMLLIFEISYTSSFGPAYWWHGLRQQCACRRPGPRLNIKTVLSTYGDFHVKDKTAVRTSYL